MSPWLQLACLLWVTACGIGVCVLGWLTHKEHQRARAANARTAAAIVRVDAAHARQRLASTRAPEPSPSPEQ